MPEGIPLQPGSDDHKQLMYKDDKGRLIPVNLLVTQPVEGDPPVIVSPSDPLPTRSTAQYIFSEETTSLLDGTEIASGWFDLEAIDKLSIEGVSGGAGLLLWLDSSTQPDGAGLALSNPFPLLPPAMFLSIPNRSRFMQVRIQNATGGAVPNVGLSLKTTYGSSEKASVLSLGVEPVLGAPSLLVQSITKGQQPDGDFVSAPADGLAFEHKTPLGIGGVYESPWIDSDLWKSIEIFISADVVSAVNGIEIEYTDDVQADPGPPTIRATDTLDYSSFDVGIGHLLVRIAPRLDGFRIRYTNGPDAQSEFFVTVTIRNAASQPTEQLLEDPLEATSVVPTVRSVLAGDTPGNGYTNVKVNDGGALITAEFSKQVALGLIPGYFSLSKFGRSAIISQNTSADLWTAGGDYTGQPIAAAGLVEAFSSSPQDGVAGTGALMIRISGLKSDTSTLYETEDIVLDGVDPVSSLNTWWRIFRIECRSYGGTVGNVGVITVRSVATPANVFATVEPGLAQTQVAAFTVPALTLAAIGGFYVSMARANGQSGSTGLGLMVREPGQTSYRADRFYEATTSSPVNPPLLTPIIIPTGSDVKVRAIDVSDNLTTLSCELDVLFQSLV
jgi:hypothetical protein